MSDKSKEIIHVQEQNKFVIALDGDPAFLEYEMGTDSTLMVMHTEVPEAHNGKGYAAQLARQVMAYAQENNLKVMPYCAYMAVFLKRNKEMYKSSVSPDFSL
jgi:predicted GNAT family acetyltransferase